MENHRYGRALELLVSKSKLCKNMLKKLSAKHIKDELKKARSKDGRLTTFTGMATYGALKDFSWEKCIEQAKKKLPYTSTLVENCLPTMQSLAKFCRGNKLPRYILTFQTLISKI
jgi:hypothetical protein